jgi:hypothetical protein
MMFLITLGIVMLISTEINDKHTCLFTEINVYKTRKIIINGTRQRNKLSTDHQQGNHQCVE